MGDVILLSLRDYQDEKADIILKYTPDEARLLKSYGELPENLKINETENMGEEEEGADVEFDIEEAREWRRLRAFLFDKDTSKVN